MIEPFASYTKLALIKPQELVDKLLISDFINSDDPFVVAQYHLCLSDAYYNVFYPQESLQQVKSTLTLVSEENQPWLYHRAQISHAMALELAGRPEEGLDDTYGHIGGEEFLFILNHSSLDDAYRVVENLRLRLIDIAPILGNKNFTLTISRGLVEHHQDDHLEDIMLLVDTALHKAKHNGRNQIVICDRLSTPIPLYS